MTVTESGDICARVRARGVVPDCAVRIRSEGAGSVSGLIRLALLLARGLIEGQNQTAPESESDNGWFGEQQVDLPAQLGK